MALALVACPAPALAGEGPQVLGVPADFVLFGLTLAGVALFHKYTLQVAVAGLVAIVLFKIGFSPFREGPGLGGFVAHVAHEWVILANLFLLLTGFAFLSRHFEKSHIPAVLPRFLPDDWKGGLAMLVIVFVLSSFLDNIAAAMIGGAMRTPSSAPRCTSATWRPSVAASNAGGSGSVVGDTTTTMMWIDHVRPIDVLPAYVAAATALLVCGVPASIVQHRYSPILKDAHKHTRVDWPRTGIVTSVLAAAIGVNVLINLRHAELSDLFPWIGTAVWVALLLSSSLRRPDWELLREAAPGSFFLLSLVLAASMMPVEELPAASWTTTFWLGLLSSVFDNIPLTKLALQQGGYDWGMLAYAVGFGGSMIWFGSSAGVAICNLYPEGRSVARWVRHGWFIAVAYVVGFLVMLLALGWNPTPKQLVAPASPAAASTPAR